jgi:RimJ/RimL family protein N-acetyltransferase
MDDQIALRPVHQEDIPMLEDLLQNPGKAGEFEWFGWRNQHRWRQGWEENGLLGPDSGTLIVHHGEVTLGMVNWRFRKTTPTGNDCEIGIVMLPDARGRGYGTQAQRTLARYLFAHTTVHRIWAGTETGNIAEQKALEKAGFSREGVHRGVGWRDGAYRDGVIYGLLRTDSQASTG